MVRVPGSKRKLGWFRPPRVCYNPLMVRPSRARFLMAERPEPLMLSLPRPQPMSLTCFSASPCRDAPRFCWRAAREARRSRVTPSWEAIPTWSCPGKVAPSSCVLAIGPSPKRFRRSEHWRDCCARPGCRGQRFRARPLRGNRVLTFSPHNESERAQ